MSEPRKTANELVWEEFAPTRAADYVPPEPPPEREILPVEPDPFVERFADAIRGLRAATWNL